MENGNDKKMYRLTEKGRAYLWAYEQKRRVQLVIILVVISLVVGIGNLLLTILMK